MKTLISLIREIARITPSAWIALVAISAFAFAAFSLHLHRLG